MVPAIAGFVVCWMIFDFLNYWMHRWDARGAALGVSQRPSRADPADLSHREPHPRLEQLYVGMLMIIPAFILGVPQPRWLPLLILQVFSETMQHHN